jgi:beta-phosphoglucomutase-like phosphatase (HAD superfamily)
MGIIMKSRGRTTEAFSVRRTGLLFEFDNLVVCGRKIFRDALHDVLKNREISLDPSLFMRFCLRRSILDCPSALLDAIARKKPRISKEKVAQEIKAEIVRRLLNGRFSLDPEMGKILDVAAGTKMSVGALTCLPMDIAEPLQRSLGLQLRGTTVLSASACEREFPTADCWLKLAKTLTLPASRCIVLATSAYSCKSALVAGMSCVAVPDAFTAWEDFSGADSVMERLNASVFRDILANVEFC